MKVLQAKADCEAAEQKSRLREIDAELLAMDLDAKARSKVSLH